MQRQHHEEMRNVRNELFEKDQEIRKLNRKVQDVESENRLLVKQITDYKTKVTEMEDVMNTCKSQITSYD